MEQSRHDAVFAQLQSQAQLRDRLLTQTRFASRFIYIAGAAGSGKSTIANMLLEQADFANQALLSLHPSQQDGEVRKNLLQQLLSQPLFNQDDRLSESYFRNVELADSAMLLVIDNAQHLSPSLLIELVELVKRYQSQFQQHISVILLAEPSSELRQRVEQLSLGVLYFDIPELSFAESMNLANLLFRRADYQADFENQDAVEQHIASAKGNPKLIYQFVDDIVTGDLPMQDSPESSRNKLYIVIAVLLCAAVAGLLVQVISEWGDEEAGNSQRITLPVAESQSTTESVDGEEAAISTAPAALPERTAETTSLPEQITAEELTLASQSSDDELRVVVEDEVVDRLLAEQASGNGTAAAEAPQVEDTGNLLEAEPEIVEGAAEVPIKMTDVRGMLLAKPEQNYTLQLVALRDREKAQQFVSSRQWAEPVWVYRSEANPNVPFKVVYGDFTKREDALKAQKQLKAQKLDSLLKQFKQVQFELKK